MSWRKSNFLLLLLSFLTSITFAQTKWEDSQITDYFHDQNTYCKIHHDTINGISIRYLESWKYEDANDWVFILHGAASHAMQYREILSENSLLEHVRIISLDRPGYGGSNPGIAMTSIQDQTDIIENVLNRLDFTSCILVGHSYGAAIVSNYAFRYPDKKLKLILLSPAIDPDLEVVFMPERLKENKLAWKLLPEKSKVGTRENLSHQVELLKIRNIWQQLDLPVHHIHGKKDWVIPWENIYFSKSQLRNDKLKISLIPNAGHSMIRYQKEFIINAIHEMITEKELNTDL